jgi:thiosulfate/3-mercaptopyruvate sulfurtransferase
MLALASLGHKDNRLYDGSWSEWGSRQDTPVVTGEAD